MPNRLWILALMIVVIMLAGCAKRNTAYQEEEWLSLEKQIPVVGDPLDISFDDGYIYVALDQGGISTIRRDNYHAKWYTHIKAADGSTYNMLRIKRVDAVNEQNKLFANEFGDTHKFIILKTDQPDTLLWEGITIGNTRNITDMNFDTISETGTNYTIEGGYCAGGSVYFSHYNDELGLVNEYNITTSAEPTGLFIKGNYMYVAVQQRGLAIYNRTTQQLEKELPLPGSALKVTILGDYAFVASRQGGLNIVNVANPATPVLVGSYATSNFTTAVDATTGKAAICSGSGGVYLFNISNPNQPVLLERLTSCGYANAVKFMNGKLIVAARDQGVLVYNIK